MGDTYTISDLSEKTGVKPRTIRYYITLGLLSGPLTQGCTAQYAAHHLKTLQRIVKLKRSGMSLAQIKTELDKSPVRLICSQVTEPETWQRYSLADDVQVEVSANITVSRRHTVSRALQRFARELNENGETS